MKFENILSEIIADYKTNSVDILGIGDDEGEFNYINILKSDYLRTLDDIEQTLNGVKSKRILEIGSFLGVVSFSLKKAGALVQAVDIPEFVNSENLQRKYKQHDVPIEGVNLRKNNLPFKDGEFDAIVICEVVEHLNFNPLPVLQEINRILKKDGVLYISMPNQAKFQHRVNLLKGISIHDPVQHYFSQLDRNDNMIVGIHWREFTIGETIEILQKMGFEEVKSYYWQKGMGLVGFPLGSTWIKSLIKKWLITFISSLKDTQIVIVKKKKESNYDFWLTEANS